MNRDEAIIVNLIDEQVSIQDDAALKNTTGRIVGADTDDNDNSNSRSEIILDPDKYEDTIDNGDTLNDLHVPTKGVKPLYPIYENIGDF